MGICVRAGEVGDLAAVVALERCVAEAPHWAEAEYAAIFHAQTLDFQDGGVRRCLLVAEAEGRVAGFAVGKVVGVGAEGLAELESVVVDVAARRAGIGRELCGAVVGWSRGQGVAVMELEVRAASAGAIALYAALGFVEVGRRPAYYQAPVDNAVLMRMGLVDAG
jgi:ribosomal-protein-alanine N-acetyltransferase